MRIAAYGAVLMIALGSVLLEMDWLSAPMSPMADTEAGLRAVAAPASAPVQPAATPSANIGVPIVPPGLAASPAPPPAGGAATPAAPSIAESEPQVHCNIEACTAAYRSFRASDCTYMPIAGQRRLCTK